LRLNKYRVRNFRFSPSKGSLIIHTIQEGDTLYRLAEEYSTSVLTIFQNNPTLDPRQLIIGEQMIISS
jgi:LysM repeat protein